MGQQKRKLEEQEGLGLLAESILEEAGYLEECPHGEKLSTGNDDLTGAYKLANYQISHKMLGNIKPRELTDAIKARYADAGEECYSCEKNRRD